MDDVCRTSPDILLANLGTRIESVGCRLPLHANKRTCRTYQVGNLAKANGYGRSRYESSECGDGDEVQDEAELQEAQKHTIYAHHQGDC